MIIGVMSTKHPLFGSASRTATLNSGSMDVGNYTEVTLYLDVTVVTGTTPTLNIDIETSHNDTDWFDFATTLSFAEATGVTTEVVEKSGTLGRFIRAAAIIGGTTPDFTFSLIAVAKA